MTGVDPALRVAITLAKRSQSREVEPDHILAGCLLSNSRFGIVRLGSLVIDLEALGIDWMQDLAGQEPGAKVAYSQASVDLLDRASEISRADQASRVRLEHLLVAFDFAEPHLQDPQGVMARLARNGVTSATWRAALAEMDTATAARPAETAAAGGYVSPEQAAEILGVHHQTIRGYIRSGKLPASRIAGERAVRIRRQDLDRLLEPVVSPEPE
jgi:excisionase family DNA binding protein